MYVKSMLVWAGSALGPLFETRCAIAIIIIIIIDRPKNDQSFYFYIM